MSIQEQIISDVRKLLNSDLSIENLSTLSGVNKSRVRNMKNNIGKIEEAPFDVVLKLRRVYQVLSANDLLWNKSLEGGPRFDEFVRKYQELDDNFHEVEQDPVQEQRLEEIKKLRQEVILIGKDLREYGYESKRREEEIFKIDKLRPKIERVNAAIKVIYAELDQVDKSNSLFAFDTSQEEPGVSLNLEDFAPLFDNLILALSGNMNNDLMRNAKGLATRGEMDPEQELIDQTRKILNATQGLLSFSDGFYQRESVEELLDAIKDYWTAFVVELDSKYGPDSANP